MFKWLLTIAIGAILIVTGFQLAPVYIQHHKVKTIAQQVVSDAELDGRPKREVVKRVADLFNEKDITNLEAAEVVSVNRDTTGDWVLGVKYEERSKLLYNLHIVAAFDDQITE